jgi:hypothetical protein
MSTFPMNADRCMHRTLSARHLPTMELWQRAVDDINLDHDQRDFRENEPSSTDRSPWLTTLERAPPRKKAYARDIGRQTRLDRALCCALARYDVDLASDKRSDGALPIHWGSCNNAHPYRSHKMRGDLATACCVRADCLRHACDRANDTVRPRSGILPLIRH